MPPVHDVAIVGFGPVGQMLALLLGRRGHDVVVLERQPAPYPRPRAVVFDSEVGRLLQSAGVADEVRAISAAVPDHYEWRNAAGEALVRIDWSGLGPGGWPVESFFCQPQLEDVLAAAAGEVDMISVHRGADVRQLVQHDDHVELTWSGPTVKAHTTRARYVIGADGANSFVRQHMSTRTEDLGFFFDWLICDVIPTDDEPWDGPMNWQLCDPARPTTLVSGGPGRRRWEFMRLPGEDVEELNTPETAWRLLEPWGRTPENSTLERHVVYTFQARWADRWNEGRLLLAGDAAHLMPPFAGQGMCSGIRDAANLAWKLDLVLRDRAPQAVLDSYTEERRAHLQHAIHMSVELGKIICVLDPDIAAERDARMIAGGADPARVMPEPPPSGLTDGVLHRDAAGSPLPGAGELGEQHPVRHGGEERPLDEFLDGPGFTLLTNGLPEADLPPAARELLDRWEVRVVPLVLPDGDDRSSYVDVHGTYLPAMRARGAAAVLVRPDFYVFGTADRDGVTGLLADLDVQLRAVALTGTRS
jgi:2-polyprenyl-6-methoxyphenol hydroxylase-like FAD-dependent oxidoreductase